MGRLVHFIKNPAIICVLFHVFSLQAQDLSLTHTHQEYLDYEIQMKIASAPLATQRITISEGFLRRTVGECTSANSNAFSSEFTADNRQTLLRQRLQSDYFYVEINQGDNPSYFLQNIDGLSFHICTLLIASNSLSVEDLSPADLTEEFFLQAIAIPGLGPLPIITLFDWWVQTSSLSEDGRIKFLNSFFDNQEISWLVLNSVIEDAFKGSYQLNQNTMEIFLKELTSTEIFRLSSVYFTKTLLSKMSQSSIDSKRKASLLFSIVDSLDIEMAFSSIFGGRDSWNFHPKGLMELYSAIQARLTPVQSSQALTELIQMEHSDLSHLKKALIDFLGKNPRNEITFSLVSIVLSAEELSQGELYTAVLNYELNQETRSNSLFFILCQIVESDDFSESRKIDIIEALSGDSELNSQKIQRLNYSTRSLASSGISVDRLESVVRGFTTHSPRNSNTFEVFRHLILFSEYSSSLTDEMTLHLINHFDLSENKIEELISRYLRVDSSSSPRIIMLLMGKANWSQGLSTRFVVEITDAKARSGNYDAIIEKILNNPETAETTKNNLRIKSTGELPSLDDLPTLTWDIFQ